MEDNKIIQEIESLKIVLEDLSTANDALIMCTTENKNFSYAVAMDHIACARQEIKSELKNLTLNEINKL